MSTQTPLQKLLTTPMTRKEFIKHVGIILLAAVGIGKLIENFLKTEHVTQQKVSSTTRWGGGKFGV